MRLRIVRIEVENLADPRRRLAFRRMRYDTHPQLGDLQRQRVEPVRPAHLREALVQPPASGEEVRVPLVARRVVGVRRDGAPEILPPPPPSSIRR